MCCVVDDDEADVFHVMHFFLACFTHPGTYMDILGFSIGGQNNIKIQAGSHEMGLRIWIGDREHSLSNSYPVLAIANTSYVATVQRDDNRHVRIKTPLMDFEMINSGNESGRKQELEMTCCISQCVEWRVN